MSEMERNHEVRTSTRDEALFIRAAMQEESRGAPRNSKADLTSLRKHERVPQVPTQLERNPKLPATKTKRFPHSHKMRPVFSTGPREQSRVLSQNSIGGLTPLSHSKCSSRYSSIATREESRVLCFNSRQGLTPQVNLERNPEIPVATGGEHGVSGHKSR